MSSETPEFATISGGVRTVGPETLSHDSSPTATYKIVGHVTNGRCGFDEVAEMHQRATPLGRAHKLNAKTFARGSSLANSAEHFRIGENLDETLIYISR